MSNNQLVEVTVYNGTIIILGGCGLVGNAVTRSLLGSRFPLFNVVVVDRRPDPNPIPGVTYDTGQHVNVFEPGYMQALVATHNPVTIIDCVNIASLASRTTDIVGAVRDYVFGVLKPIAQSGVALVDVGTVATGGMGINLGFTHNEATGDGNIAPGLVLKNVAASVHGGFLDLLGRTPGYRVGRVVPRAMIGFEPPFFGGISVAHLGGVPDMTASQFLAKGDLKPVPFQINGGYDGVGVRCGENGEFGLEETVAITAIGQMETVTAEAVADAVMDVLMRVLATSNGGTYVQHDVHPDVTSFAQRQRLIKQMVGLCEANQVHSVAFGNLGPYLTCGLWELQVLSMLGFTPRTLSGGLTPDLKVSKHGDVTNLLAVALPGLGIPIVTDHFFCPARLATAKRVTAEEAGEQMRRVDLTGAEKLWAVDLRHAHLQYWVDAAKALMEANPSDFARSHLPLSWDKLLRPGSFWAAYATITGHGRAPYSAGSRY